MDSDAQPPCYRLRPISCHIPGFKESSLEDREKAFIEWATEIDKTLGVLIAVFSHELRDTYLTTVVEQVSTFQNINITILNKPSIDIQCGNL